MRNQEFRGHARLALFCPKQKPNVTRLFSVALFAALLFSAFARFDFAIDASGATLSRSQAPDLNTIIDGLQRKYSRMRGLDAEFVQIFQGANGQTARETGRLLLKRPGKARWEYTSPERKLFVSDGKNIYFYVEGERQATETTIKESVDPQIPFLFLLGR